jgi:aryl-alcohol dehydrogenase-like predicted oxidoreductase
MPPLPFGQTGLHVTRVGFGAMHFDGLDDEAAVGRLLNGALDLGINLIDTARGYGRSEERIGRHLAHRRHEFVLSTKFGYGVDGVPDWTYPCIVQGVERALRLMRTDVIDIGHLHSCPLPVLQRGEVTEALADCVRAGKLRVAAYSGENAELARALADDRFASVQCSLSLVDQANAPQVAATVKGVLVKRALGGRAWAQAQRPEDFCEGQYWDRWQALGLTHALPDLGLSWPDVALRWAAHRPGVASVLVGSQRLENLSAAVATVAQGPLPAEVLAAVDAAWTRVGRDWPGLV